MTDPPINSTGAHAQLFRLARAAADAIERLAVPIYATIIAAFLIIFLVAAHFLTLEADEAWNLLSIMNAFGIPLPETGALDTPVLTNGGMHMLLHGALAWLTTSIFAHRVISIIFTGLLIGIVFRLLKRMDRPTPIAWTGTALFAAVPNLILQASLATAEIIATVLLLVACMHWLRRGQSSYTQAVASGFLIGLSCATRLNCLIALPAILIHAVLSGPAWRVRLPRAVVACSVGGLTTVLGVAAYFLAAHTGSIQQAQKLFLLSTGLHNGHKSIVRMLFAVVIGNRIIPLWLAAAIAGAYVISAAEGPESGELAPTSLSGLLLLIGLGGLAAWIIKAPIPHVRYMWPAVPFLWLAGIIAVTQPTIARQKGYPALAFHLFVLAVCGSRMAEDALIIANGESLTLVYQANSTAPFQLPHKSLRAARDQQALAHFVAAQSGNAHFYAFSAVAFPITLLSRRTISPVTSMGMAGQRFLILDPADVTVWHPDASFVQWIRSSTTPAFVSGDFAALRIKDDAGAPPQPLMFTLGENDVLRPDPK